MYYLLVFVQKWWHCILVKILDLSELGVSSYKFFMNFFFLSKVFSIFFLDHEICYLHVSLQICRHSITIKILHQLDKRAFSLKFYPIYFVILFYFFLYRNFHLFLRPLNILSTSFEEKMVTLHSGQNSRQIGTRGIFVQNLPNFFFLSKEFSIFFFDHKICYLCVLVQKCRHCILVKIHDQSDKMAFSYKFYPIYFFILFYIFSIKFSTCFWDLWIYYLLVFLPKWWHCILVEILDLSNLGVFCTNFSRVFFFFFVRKNFPFFSWTMKYAICMFRCKNAKILSVYWQNGIF